MRKLVAGLFVTGAWLAIGCESGRAPVAGRVVISDSGSVRISTSDLRNIEALRHCTAAERPDLRIGTADGPLTTQLFRVEGALRLPDGRFAILNRGTQEIRFFDATGSFMSSVGRDGEGPGEFRDPIEISVLTPDSLVVWDWELNRVSVLTVDGTFVRAFSPQPTAPNPTGRIGVADFGRTVVIGLHELSIPSGPGFVPQRLLLLRYDVDGAFQDTVATLSYGSVGVIDAESRMAGGPIFDARGSFATDGRNLYLADGSEAEVRVLNASHKLARILRWTPPDRTVTPEDVDRYKSERLKGLSGGALQLARKRYEAVPASAQFPSVSNILIDSGGNTWVRRFQRPFFEMQTWWRFDSQGAFRCALDLPMDLNVVQFDSGFVVAVAKDDLGTESVVAFRLAGIE